MHPIGLALHHLGVANRSMWVVLASFRSQAELARHGRASAADGSQFVK
jgi:hypothetical protein